MNHHIADIMDADFDREVLNANQPVLVEFWAAWSGLCQSMTPIIESVAEDDDGSTKFIRVNVENHEELTAQCGVRAVPTLLIYSRGAVHAQLVGRTTELEIRETLERAR